MHNQENQETATEIYRRIAAQQKVEVVDVVVPSGFVFQFRKLTNFDALFGNGQLPFFGASRAVEAWKERGYDTSSLTVKQTSELEIAERSVEAAGNILEFSYNPKIVARKAQNANELSYKDISEPDMVYLMRWMIAGGDESLMLSMFPQRPESDVATGVNRGKIQSQTKRTRRNKR